MCPLAASGSIAIRKGNPFRECEELVEERHINGVRLSTIAGFLDTRHVAFQRGRAKGINAVYHLSFTGQEPAEATVTTGTCRSAAGHARGPDVRSHVLARARNVHLVHEDGLGWYSGWD